MATALTPKLPRRRHRATGLTIALSLAALVVAAIGLNGLTQPGADRRAAASTGAAQHVPGGEATRPAQAGLAPASLVVPSGSISGCDQGGIAGDLVGEQASPHEVFEAYLALCRAQ